VAGWAAASGLRPSLGIMMLPGLKGGAGKGVADPLGPEPVTAPPGVGVAGRGMAGTVGTGGAAGGVCAATARPLRTRNANNRFFTVF